MDFIFFGSKITADGNCSHEIKRHLFFGRKAMTNLDSILKSRDFAATGLSSQSYGFSSCHVWMWELGYKKDWVAKNWCLWTVLEKTLESPLDCNEIKPVNPKGNQFWVSIGRTDGEAEAPILGHLMWRADSLEKTLILGKIEGRSRRGWQRMRCLDIITDSMDVFEQAQGDGEEQGSLTCCSSWGHKELDMTERLNNKQKYVTFPIKTLCNSYSFNLEI